MNRRKAELQAIDLGQWPTVAYTDFDPRAKAAFQTRMLAVQQYANGRAIKGIELEHGINRRQLYRWLDRALAQHDDGRINGYGGKMRKDKRKSREPKGVYRVRNWPEYNAGLIARGSLTMWIDESAFTSGSEARPVKRGRPQVYSDPVIQAVLTLKHVYHLTLRAAQGFVQSLRKLAFGDLPVPNYTTLSRRSQELQVTLPERSSGDPIHLVIDSTGVKVFGEGEWKVRKHGYSKRRTWRKVHLGLDVKTGQIRAALMTHQDVDDASALPCLLAQIPADEPIDTVGGDGAYDTKQCHKVIDRRSATPSIPPREGAKPWPEGTPGASWRNEAINGIARDGRDEWKKHSGYHRRSLIENTMYRFKTLTGDCLSARCIGSQATEVAIRVGIINHMVTIARPQSVRNS